MILAALMATGPLLAYGKSAAGRLGRGLVVPSIIAILAASYLGLARGIHNPWALACVVVVALLGSAMAIQLVRAVADRARSHSENPLLATIRLLDGNHRRYGGQVVHVGIAMILVGVVGSSLFSVKQDVPLEVGKTAKLGAYTLRLDSIEPVDGANYQAVRAGLTLTSPSVTATLAPERRRYDKAEEANSVVAIRSTWREDVYVNLADWTEDGKTAVIQAIVNPLVSWLWTGGWVLVAGTLICLAPRITARKAVVEAQPPVAAATPAIVVNAAKAVVEAEPVPPANRQRPRNRKQRRAHHRAAIVKA
jgi:cytochrome c-type biogenesis protein CcmF